MIKRKVTIKSLELRGTLRTHVKTGVSTTPTQGEVDAALRPLFLAAMERERYQIQTTANPRNFKTHSVLYGPGISPIPSKTFVDESPVKVSHKDFKRRSAMGEILLSPFKQWGAVISYTNGSVPSKKVPTKPVNYGFDTYKSSLGVNATSNGILVGDYYWIGSCISQWETIYYEKELSPYDLGWVDPDKELFDSIMSSENPDNGQITSTLGEHNTRTLDALTAMAEMPETVKMIINACKTAIRMYLDARKKAFRLQNKVAKWKNAKTSDANRRQIIRNINEANAAIADVWLTYRYGIMPNVYLIEDLLKAYGASDTLFLRDRSREVYASGAFSAPPGWNKSSDLDITRRVMIKSRLKPGSTKIDSQFSFNLVKTAYELIPLSFVLDWFVNIGDMLSATMPAAYAAQGATISWKADTTTWFLHPESGASVEIQYKGYRRMVIDPLQYCKFEWSPHITNARAMDALSLTWKMFIESNLRKLS